MEKKLLHGVASTHRKCVLEEIIQQEVKRKKKQDKVIGEVKVAVMKGDATCPDVLACSIYEKRQCKLFKLWLKILSGLQPRRKYTLKLGRRQWT